MNISMTSMMNRMMDPYTIRPPSMMYHMMMHQMQPDGHHYAEESDAKK